jgi:hypothetical protein
MRGLHQQAGKLVEKSDFTAIIRSAPEYEPQKGSSKRVTSGEVSATESVPRALRSYWRILIRIILLNLMLGALAATAFLAAVIINTGLGLILMLGLIAGLVGVFSAAASRSLVQ